VPPTKELREKVRARCNEVASRLEKDQPLTKDEMEVVTRRILSDMDQPESYLGWTMVVFASEFWRDQVAATPPSRRLFLLPHCLKHAEGCPADYDEFGLACKECGACSIADFRTVADDMGYRVLVAEGSPIVLKIIISGYVDAVVGVACLNVLEKAIDKILLAGIPCMAVPLLSSDCRNTSVDEDWVSEMIELQHEAPAQSTRTYIHLMRAAAQMFEERELNRLAPRQRGSEPIRSEAELGSLDPIAATETLAYDFLAKGGKHSRPFITLAIYDALRGGDATLGNGQEHTDSIPDAVRRAAMAIETFHKASLVHDDIEDDDAFRYGAPTMHRRWGVPTAINVGDYLIGMGYRLVSRESAALGAETAAAVLDLLAEAHLKLSEGQGAELMWRDASDKRLKPIDALKIYALKTSPAFEAAFFSGVRLAEVDEDYTTSLKKFSRNLGVAFQILNDLNDWQGDAHNKLEACGDTLGGRPTILWALALEGLPPAQQQELLDLVDNTDLAAEIRVNRVRQLYNETAVFEKALRLVEKYQDLAEAIADEIQPEALRRLLYYLIDTVLESPTENPAVTAPPTTIELTTTVPR
jgi:geranylgeranyl pyrophosphate synthase